MVDPNLFAKLEAMGLDAVRKSVVMGKANQPGTAHHEAVIGWVKLKDDEAAAAAAARSEAREEENLSISRKALRNSERATRIAISAMILSIVMAIKVIIDLFSK